MDHPGRYWCMSCFHLSTIHYDPHRVIPFRVDCLMGEGDAPCARCSQRNALCEPPSMGIQGDAQDLCAILDWTTRFWSRSDSYTWTNEFRFAVCQASKVLCASFEDADYDHRRYHMLAEIDYARRPSNAQENDFDRYRSFLARRRSVLRSPTPPTDAVTGAQCAGYNPERLLRLRDGDFGHENWAQAKADFKGAIRGACVREYGDEFTSTGRCRLRSIIASFPRM